MSTSLGAIKTGVFLLIFGLLFAGGGFFVHTMQAKAQEKETTFVSQGVTVDSIVSTVNQESKTSSTGTGSKKKTKRYTEYTPTVSYTVESTNQSLSVELPTLATKTASTYSVGGVIPIAYMESNPSDVIPVGAYGAIENNSGVMSIILYIVGGLVTLGGVFTIVRRLL